MITLLVNVITLLVNVSTDPILDLGSLANLRGKQYLQEQTDLILHGLSRISADDKSRRLLL